MLFISIFLIIDICTKYDLWKTQLCGYKAENRTEIINIFEGTNCLWLHLQEPEAFFELYDSTNTA